MNNTSKTHQTIEAAPPCYLSTSDGMWRTVVSGLPICADTPFRSRAEAAATQMRVVPTAIWNGDTGKWEAMQPEWKRRTVVAVWNGDTGTWEVLPRCKA
jgi:hypothetical protein